MKTPIQYARAHPCGRCTPPPVPPPRRGPAEPAGGPLARRPGEGVPLGLEAHLAEIAEVLAVGLDGKRPVAADGEAIEIVADEERLPVCLRGCRGRRPEVGDITMPGAARGLPRNRARPGSPPRRAADAATKACVGRQAGRSGTTRSAARPKPSTSSWGAIRKRVSRSVSNADARYEGGRCPRAAPASRSRPRASMRRTASAIHADLGEAEAAPVDAAERISTACVPARTPRARVWSAALTRSRGEHRARARGALAPPPSPKPKGTSPAAPLTASLVVPSPAKTKQAAPTGPAAWAASSRAWSRRSGEPGRGSSQRARSAAPGRPRSPPGSDRRSKKRRGLTISPRRATEAPS